MKGKGILDRREVESTNFLFEVGSQLVNMMNRGEAYSTGPI
jgi:hypothetical protein